MIYDDKAKEFYTSWDDGREEQFPHQRRLAKIPFAHEFYFVNGIHGFETEQCLNPLYDNNYEMKEFYG